MIRKIFPAFLFLLPVMILIPHLAGFPFTAGAEYSDVAISHYPNSLYLQRVLFHEGRIPLWSSAILSGYPFAANPLAGLFYPPGWLALLFPLPLGLNVVIVLHLIWGGAGMYRLLRDEGLAQAGALLGALTFAALPKLYSHLGAGHVTLIYAVSWTPWLLFATRRANSAGILRYLLPGAVLGIIALADIRWAAYAGLFWLVYSLRGVNIKSGVQLAVWSATLLTNALFSLLCAAALLLPLVEYTRLSTRASLTADDSLILSLPFGQLFGLVYPFIGGTPEWILYPGAVAAVLALYALCVPALRRRSGFWLVGILMTLLLSLGAAVPLLPLIMQLPGLDLLRVPPRVLFLTGMCFAAAAAYAANWLLNEDHAHGSPAAAARDRSPLVLFAIGTFVALLGAAALFFVEQPLARIQFAWGAVFFSFSVVLVLLARARRLKVSALVVLLLALQLIDITAVNGLSLDFRSRADTFSAGHAVAEFLRGQPVDQPYRVYSPSYSLPQHVAIWYGLELADGVDPLQLGAYADFMDRATGVPRTEYSVTVPPFANGEPQRDNRHSRPDAALLGLLNVRYVVAEFPQEVDGLRLLAKFGESRVYENTLAMPRAWVQPLAAPLGTQIQSTVDVQRGTDWIALDASGPGLLVLSEIAYPGWQVRVDGTPAALEIPGDLLRGVILPPGEHQVRFTFYPLSVYGGLVLSLASWTGFLVIVWLERKRNG